jgi:PleD family two-component response regulator
MKSSPETANTPVIYLAPPDYPLDEAKREALELGALDVMAVPVDSISLVSALKNALKGKQRNNTITASAL